MGYYIQGYPLKWDRNDHYPETVKSPYVVKFEGTPFPLGPNVVPHEHMNEDQGTQGMDRNNEQMMNTQAGPSTRPDHIQEHSE